MRIWLIKTGESLPLDGQSTRLLRMGILAEYLVQCGHEVIWWTACFNHAHKKHRAFYDQSVKVNDKYAIKLIFSQGYRTNVSWRRIADHKAMADRFTILAEQETPPDMILCALPTLNLAKAAASYGLNHNIPVVLDVRDMWPDIFYNLFPSYLRGFARLLIYPADQMCCQACRKATAIVGITEPFVEWALKKGKRNRNKWDKAFYIGYNQQEPLINEKLSAHRFWEDVGIHKADGSFIVCFFGTLGRQFEIETVIEAATLIHQQDSGIRFVICGTGDKIDYYKKLALDCDNICFPGWVDHAQIWSLLDQASIGLAPYINSFDFQKSIPNKPPEYLSASLPVITCLDGELKNLLFKYDCGLYYHPGDALDLADKIIMLRNQPEVLARMSANARKLFESHFNADNIYHDFVIHLQTIEQEYVKH